MHKLCQCNENKKIASYKKHLTELTGIHTIRFDWLDMCKREYKMMLRFKVHQSVRMVLLAGLGLGLSACVTVNKGMGSLQDSDAVLAVETHSPLDTCLLSKR